jgi:hypothetical protein
VGIDPKRDLGHIFWKVLCIVNLSLYLGTDFKKKNASQAHATNCGDSAYSPTGRLGTLLHTTLLHTNLLHTNLLHTTLLHIMLHTFWKMSPPPKKDIGV